jgi:hypothetical protein
VDFFKSSTFFFLWHIVALWYSVGAVQDNVSRRSEYNMFPEIKHLGQSIRRPCPKIKHFDLWPPVYVQWPPFSRSLSDIRNGAKIMIDFHGPQEFVISLISPGLHWKWNSVLFVEHMSVYWTFVAIRIIFQALGQAHGLNVLKVIRLYWKVQTCIIMCNNLRIDTNIYGPKVQVQGGLTEHSRVRTSPVRMSKFLLFHVHDFPFGVLSLVH